jgi:hypothetical protein
MESNDVQPDAIVCSSLMEALNNGSQPEREIHEAKTDTIEPKGLF